MSNRKSLMLFFILAFGISWILWLPAFLKTEWTAFSFIAPFGPSLAAVIVTLAKREKGAVRKLLSSGFRKPAGLVWLLPLLLIGPVSSALTIGILILLKEPVLWEYALPPAMIAPVFLIIFIGNGLAEEYGWRGTALPLLEKRLSVLGASVILGALWSLWHLPLFFIEGTTQEIIPFYQYALQTIVFSLLYSWIAHLTSFSVLAAAFFHAVNNISAAVFPFWIDDTGRWIQFALLTLFTVVLVLASKVFKGDRAV